MRNFVERHTFWAIVILVAAAMLMWMIFAVWPEWLVQALGRKKTFVNTLLNGITLGGLYFLVASGFTLIFGLMRNVNLAHGAMYLLGGYIGYEIAEYTGNWFVGLVVAFLAVGISGILLQVLIFRRMEGDDLRQTLVTIGISIIAADVMLAIWTGTTYQFSPPEWLFGATVLPVISVIKSSGAEVYIKYPVYRLAVLAIAIAVGVGLWLFLNRTKIGMMIRAGVNDREMLSASGVNVQLVFSVVFAIGAGLAGFAGVIGGTALSIAPGEDVRYLLASLVVVIVGGLGSISGAAIGALIIGLAEQFGLAYFPTYGVVLTFLIMVVVLAVRPQGIMGGR
jgi:branched-chain amino acid transport system permease protein